MNENIPNIPVGQKPETIRHRHQHITAFILVFLGLWMSYALFTLRHATYHDVVTFFQTPLYAFLTLILLASALHHASIGMQNVALDYCDQSTTMYKQRLIKLVAMALMILSILAILKIIFGV